MIAAIAACISIPVNLPEFTSTPSFSTYASVISSMFSARSFGCKVRIFRMPYFVANIQSR